MPGEPRIRLYWRSFLMDIDIEGLKAANDVFGHEIEDRLIRDVARIVRRSFRASNVVACLGGGRVRGVRAQRSVAPNPWALKVLVCPLNVGPLQAVGGGMQSGFPVEFGMLRVQHLNGGVARLPQTGQFNFSKGCCDGNP